MRREGEGTEEAEGAVARGNRHIQIIDLSYNRSASSSSEPTSRWGVLRELLQDENVCSDLSSSPLKSLNLSGCQVPKDIGRLLKDALKKL